MATPSIIVVGAGLAGLAAARNLQQRGCGVVIFEARARAGGRVWTLRHGFGGMHGEAGGELIDADQTEIRNLARELGLVERRVLRGGFAHFRLGNNGRRRMRSAQSGWQAVQRAIDPLVRAYKINEEEWSGPIAENIAARSVGDWLDETAATLEVRASAASQSILRNGAATELLARLRFFGVGRQRLTNYRSITWEDDPWSRGAYAVFDRSFHPSARRLLALPSGRIFFAGEHTSAKWQGYRNGAVASGLRAAEEITATFL